MIYFCDSFTFVYLKLMLDKRTSSVVEVKAVFTLRSVLSSIGFIYISKIVA